MMDEDDDHEDRHPTVRLWIKEKIHTLKTIIGRSLKSGESFIIEIPDYLDDRESK